LVRLTVLIAAIVGLFFVFRGDRYGIVFGHPQSFPHYVQATVPSAFEVIPGERVISGGVDEGEITQAYVTRTGQAHLVLGIQNDVWPLPSDTLFTLRMGGTIKYTDRFVEITKGHARTALANWGSIAPGRFLVPVEYGQFFNIFNKQTRQSMRTLFGDAGPTLQNAVGPFQKTLPVAAPPLNQGAAIFADLGYSQQALSTLVASGAQLSKAIATSNPGLQTLLTGAANTFSVTAQESGDLTKLIQIGHNANIGIGNILFHVPKTLKLANTMAQQIDPGLTQVDQLAQPFNGTLRALTSIEPAAVHTLNTVQTNAPAIDNLLAVARTDLLPQLQSVSSQAATELNCIRPYTPDIMNVVDGFAGFNNRFAKPNMTAFNALVSLQPYPGLMPINSVQLHQLLPNMQVGTHPPGTGWNQPWYQPTCNITPVNNTAAGDAENGTFDPAGSKTFPFASSTPSFGPVPARGVPVRTAP
jgi:ABC-type transporter Mla subunit MlaD